MPGCAGHSRRGNWLSSGQKRQLLFPTLCLLVVMVFSSLSETHMQATDTLWVLIGNDGNHLSEQRAAGIDGKLLSLSWRRFNPAENLIDQAYLNEKLTEYRQLRDFGFEVILSLGMHDIPEWLHDNYPNTHYKNQYDEPYTGYGEIDSGDANFIFNTTLRPLAERYIATIFTVFDTGFAAVRVGGGRYGELTYPPAAYEGQDNCYWAFDTAARAQSPVENWHPGDPSPNNEAEQFLNWYLDTLAAYQTWQIDTVRQHYTGPIMILYPSWGLRPGDIDAALATNLDGSTSAETNGEIQRGYDFDRQIAAITDENIIVTTTWLDADASRDDEDDPRYWSPVKTLATLAADHPFNLAVFGENTGQGNNQDMRLAASQMQRYNLIGMAWYREDELHSGQYATLDDYAAIIAEFNAP
jgi:hypothetical protein